MDGRGGGGASRRQRAVATASGVAVHLLLAAMFLASARGVVSRGAERAWSEGDAVEVMLAGREGGAAARGYHGQAPPATQSQLDQLVQRLRADNSDLFTTETEAPRPRGDLASLFDGPAQGAARGRSGDGEASAGQSPDGGDQAGTARASLAGGGGEQAGAAGLLWSHVKPCWSRLPGRSTVPVTLELSLTPDGRLAKPPKIIRPTAGRPDEARLLAEARALQAITACLPYADAAGFAMVQKVGFPGA